MTILSPYDILVLNIIDYYNLSWTGHLSDFQMEEQYSCIDKDDIKTLNSIQKKEYEQLAVNFNYDRSIYTELCKNIMLVDYLSGRVKLPETLIEKLMKDIIKYDFLLHDSFIVDTGVFTEKMLKNVILRFPVNTNILSLFKQILITKLKISSNRPLTYVVKEGLNGRRSVIISSILNNMVLDVINNKRKLSDPGLQCIKQDIKETILGVRPYDIIFIQISQKSKSEHTNVFYSFNELFTLDEFLQFYLNCICYCDTEQENYYDLFMENLTYFISSDGKNYNDAKLEKMYKRFFNRFFISRVFSFYHDFIHRMFPVSIEDTEILRHLAIIIGVFCMKERAFLQVPIHIRDLDPVSPENLIEQLHNMKFFYDIIQEKYEYPSSLLSEKELNIYLENFKELPEKKLWQLLLFKYSYNSGQFLSEECVQFYKTFCGIDFGSKNEEVQLEIDNYRFLKCNAESIIITVAHKYFS